MMSEQLQPLGAFTHPLRPSSAGGTRPRYMHDNNLASLDIHLQAAGLMYRPSRADV